MNILCASQGQRSELDGLISHFAADPGATVLAASLPSRRERDSANIKRIVIKKRDPAKFARSRLGYWELALKTAANANDAWEALKRSGFEPRLVLLCASNGIGFCLRDAFPKAVIASYADSSAYGLLAGASGIREARREVERIQFERSDLCFARYPEQREGILAQSRVLPPFVDVDFFKQQPQMPKGGNLKTVALMGGPISDAEFHELWLGIQELLAIEQELRLKIIAAAGMQRFAWRALALKLPPGMRGRLQLAYPMDRESWRAALAETCLLACVKPGVSCYQMMLEAMSMGAPIMAGECGFEFFMPGQNSLPLQGSLPHAVKRALQDAPLLARIAAAGADAVKSSFAQASIVPRHAGKLAQLCREKRVVNEA